MPAKFEPEFALLDELLHSIAVEHAHTEAASSSDIPKHHPGSYQLVLGSCWPVYLHPFAFPPFLTCPCCQGSSVASFFDLQWLSLSAAPLLSWAVRPEFGHPPYPVYFPEPFTPTSTLRLGMEAIILVSCIPRREICDVFPVLHWASHPTHTTARSFFTHSIRGGCQG
eukprot:773914-Pelagomonas_calceolata.AAC.1